jgi:hypothetical protein
MEEDTQQSWQRIKTILLLIVIFSLFIFPMFTNKEAEDQIGEPEIKYIPNSNKIQITLFPSKRGKQIDSILSFGKKFMNPGIRVFHSLHSLLLVDGLRMYSLILETQATSALSERLYYVVSGNVPTAVAHVRSTHSNNNSSRDLPI